MTRLYLHYKSKAVPLLTLPTAAKLADIAKLSSKHRDWETAVAAAQDVAATDTQAAARLIKKIMGVMQIYGGSIIVAAAAMPLLHAAGQHDSVVKVTLHTDWSTGGCFIVFIFCAACARSLGGSSHTALHDKFSITFPSFVIWPLCHVRSPLH